MDSLFTNIPMQETIDYIIGQIYTEKKLPQICSKTIFRRLFLKVTTECSFQLKQKLYKQTEGCSMGGLLSVTLADIHMIRTENDASAKWRAQRAHVPYVPTCPTCSTCPTCPSIFYRPEN